ncbi:hypothetical protein Hanom_Chr01g00085691 [Helianthus anomalus]
MDTVVPRRRYIHLHFLWLFIYANTGIWRSKLGVSSWGSHGFKQWRTKNFFHGFLLIMSSLEDKWRGVKWWVLLVN